MQNEVLGVNWPVNERTTNQTKLKLPTIVGDVSQKIYGKKSFNHQYSEDLKTDMKHIINQSKETPAIRLTFLSHSFLPVILEFISN